MNIVVERTLLRAIEEYGPPHLQAGSNDPEIQRMLGGWHLPVSVQDQRWRCDQLRVDSTNQRYAVEMDGQGPVRTGSIVSIDWKNRTASHGIMLGNPDARGKGIARKLT